MAGVIEEAHGIWASDLELSGKGVDGDQHCGPLSVFDGVEHLEADSLQSIPDDANVIERIGQRTNTRLVVLIADNKRNALLLCVRPHSKKDKRDSYSDPHPHPMLSP